MLGKIVTSSLEHTQKNEKQVYIPNPYQLSLAISFYLSIVWIDLKTKNPFLIILLNEYILDSEVMKIINMSIERKSEQKQIWGS